LLDVEVIENPAAVVARDEPAWRTWMERKFPRAGAAPEGASAA
jgi:hypothetical protein